MSDHNQGLTEFLKARLDEDEHIARHDPVRILREVEAKRAVINMVPLSQEEAEERFAGFFVEEGAGWEKAQEYVLKHLATIYADHPDYQQEWADE